LGVQSASKGSSGSTGGIYFPNNDSLIHAFPNNESLIHATAINLLPVKELYFPIVVHFIFEQINFAS
jgi:hypothetical protein